MKPIGMVQQGRQLSVIIESELDGAKAGAMAIMELQKADTRNLAIKHATENGVANARVGMPEHPYPVDASGNEVTNPATQKVAKYRIAIPITSVMHGSFI